jgi:hypothetical protein
VSHVRLDTLAESTGLNKAAERAGSPYIRVDLDALLRDLKMAVYTVDSSGRVSFPG